LYSREKCFISPRNKLGSIFYGCIATGRLVVGGLNWKVTCCGVLHRTLITNYFYFTSWQLFQNVVYLQI